MNKNERKIVAWPKDPFSPKNGFTYFDRPFRPTLLQARTMLKMISKDSVERAKNGQHSCCSECALANRVLSYIKELENV